MDYAHTLLLGFRGILESHESRSESWYVENSVWTSAIVVWSVKTRNVLGGRAPTGTCCAIFRARSTRERTSFTERGHL